MQRLRKAVQRGNPGRCNPSMKRPGAIPRLQQLPDLQTEALVRWLTVEHLTYSQARARLKQEFGVTTTMAGLSSFWHCVCLPRQQLEERRAMATATRGKLLVEIQIRALPDRSLTVTIIGGEVAAHVGRSDEPGVTTLRLIATPLPAVPQDAQST